MDSSDDSPDEALREDKGPNKRLAKIGCFIKDENGILTQENAYNVWVLAIHYDFKATSHSARCGCANDVQNLEKTFSEKRNCNFKEFPAREKEDILNLMRNKERLLQTFNSNIDQIPSVFIIFILGQRGEQECNRFTIDDFHSSLGKLESFSKCLKICMFNHLLNESDGLACQSEKENQIRDDACLEIYCQPQITQNFTIMYSTVEHKVQTNAEGKNEPGSFFVRAICEILDEMNEDSHLLHFLSDLEGKLKRKKGARTAALNTFSEGIRFVISALTKSEEVTQSCDTTVTDRRSSALIFYSDNSNDARQICEALSKINLYPIAEKLSNVALEKHSSPAVDGKKKICPIVWLIASVVYGTGDEISVLAEGEVKPIRNIIHKLDSSPKEMRTGKPKILFVIDEANEKNAEEPEKERAIKTINQSGWLVLVLNKCHMKQMIHIFDGVKLNEERINLHDLLAQKYSTGQMENEALIIAALQRLFDISDKQTFFATPSLLLNNGANSAKSKIGYNDLLKKAKNTQQSSCFLLSSVSGGGKTTIMRKMVEHLTEFKKDGTIVHISMEETASYLRGDCLTAKEYLASATHHSVQEVADWIHSERINIFLDDYDEISSADRRNALKIINEIRDMNITVWISKELEETTDFQNRPNSKLIIVEIEPFDIFKQLHMLQLVFRKNNGKQITIRNKKYAHCSSILEQGKRTPSSTRMHSDNLYLVYGQWLSKQIENAVESRLDREEAIKRIFKCLKSLAFSYIADSTFKQEAWNKEDMECLKKTGIVKIDSGFIMLLHQNIIEYLLAKTFVDEMATSEYAAGLTLLFKSWCLAPCRKFVDLYFSTLREDQRVEYSKQLLIFSKKQPQCFLNNICKEDLDQIFSMLEPHITFEKRSDSLYVEDWEKLVLDSVGSENIARRLIEKIATSDCMSRLSAVMVDLLDRVAEHNAILFFERLKEIFQELSQSLPDIIKSRNNSIVAGITAAEHGHYQILDFLLENGVDVNINLRSRRTGRMTNLLQTALERGDVDCLKVLLKHHVDLEKFDSVDGEMSWGTLPERLSKGSGIAHFAAFAGFKEMMLALHQHDASLVHRVNARGFTPLHFAAWKNNWEIGLWLAEEAGVDVQILDPSRSSHVLGQAWTSFNTTAHDFMLHLVAEMCFKERNPTKLMAMINKKLEGGQSLLHAIREDSRDMCQFLIESKIVGVHDIDAKGQTALHAACIKNFKEVCKVLLNEGANVNAIDCERRTPLHYAAKYGDIKLIELLIQKGGNPLLKDKHGRSALFYGNFLHVTDEGVISSADSSLCLNIALHRYFTYPPNFHLKYGLDMEKFVEAGFFYVKEQNQDPMLHCYSCEFEIEAKDFPSWINLDVSSILKKKGNDCDICLSNTENVPMRSYHVPNFKYEAIRLYSVLEKKDWMYVTPLELAKSGFYYTGDDDSCRCAFCNLEVRGWEEGDTPSGEHERFNPSCPLLRNNPDTNNVKIGHEAAAACNPDQMKGISDPFLTTEVLSDCLGSHLLQKETSSSNTAVRDLNLMLWSTSKAPRFANLHMRKDTFRNWPRSMVQREDELARAGFYYTGIGDRVACFHCGLGLMDWAHDDNPYNQHVKWSPACQFMLVTKGSNYIRSVLFNTNEIEVQPEIIQTHSGDGMQCRLCENGVQLANLPCGHINVCDRCGGDKCLTCATPIEATVKIFIN